MAGLRADRATNERMADRARRRARGRLARRKARTRAHRRREPSARAARPPQRGYLTAVFIAKTAYCSANFGLDRGFLHYEDYGISPGRIVRGSALARLIASDERLRDLIGVHELLGRKPAEQVNSDFLRWLDRREPGRPFFAFLNYYDAHDPYQPPAEFARKFSPVIPRGYFREGVRLPREVIDELRDAYDGAIAYLDHELGRLLAELRERGLLDDTLLIVTSDHGESLGEHGLMSHGNSLYLTLLRVPLVIVHPARIPAGRSIAEPVSLRDIPATSSTFSVSATNSGFRVSRFRDIGRILRPQRLSTTTC